MSLYNAIYEPADETVKIFDGFYNNNLVVPANQYEIIRSYFIGVCDSVDIANNYTAIIFRIAQESDVNALDLLAEIKTGTNNTIELTQIMTYYLNSFKSTTSLYGIAVVPRPIQPIARNVVL